MNDNTTRVPATEAPTHAAAPRTISHTQMTELLQQGHAHMLAPSQRYRIFVRYANTWWIDSRDGYCEITDEDHNRKLDRWRRRLTEGALWA
jgi:hypothetical protein